MKLFKIKYRNYQSMDQKRTCLKYENWPKPLLLTGEILARSQSEALYFFRKYLGIKLYQIEDMEEAEK